MDSIDQKLSAGVDKGQQTQERQGATSAGTLKDMASSSRRTPSRSTSPRLTRSATTPVLSTTQNLSASPLPSREVSPIRPSQPAAKYSTARVSRSRKNSSDQSPQRISPSHTPTTATQTVPSAAAVQRALAAVGEKKLPSPTTATFTGDTLEPRKSARGTVSTAAAQSRLTSPPVSKTKAPGSRIPEPQPPAAANNGTPKPATAIETIQEEDDSESAAAESRFPGRGSVGGKLETVQEDSPVQTPSMSDSAFAAQRPTTIQEDPDEDNPDMVSSQTTAGTRSSTKTGENGSGSDEMAAGKKNKGKEQQKVKEPEKPAEAKTGSSTAPASRKPSITQLAPKPAIQPRRSFQHLNPARNKEGSVKSMTVETETVSNPELLGAVGDREGRSASGTTGSVRTKASTETIRPKREKKRVRKAPSIANGPASSKADIFEAKVASAVDEAANSSDSDETFVYESNPPEARSSHRNAHGHRFHHSRTPSAASMASQSTDNYRNNHFGISGKKSMKFVNANQLRDPEDEDSQHYPSNTARSSHRHHHHLARLNRLQNQSTESESPVSSLRSPRTRQFNSWRTHGPRPGQEQDNLVSAMADKPQNASMYDLSHGAEADDEFTPLLSSRSGRNDPRLRRGRLREEQYRRTPLRSCFSCAKYTCITIVVGAVVALVTVVLVLCKRGLFDEHVTSIGEVLASEQELFLSMKVTARNPNIVDISVAEGDLDLFAKSKYVGTTEMWRDGTIPGIEPPESNSTRALQYMPDDNVDDGTDPIEEPGSGTHTMLLGKVTDLDSALIFASSPFAHDLRHSVASLRLGKPGNKTEEGGSRRWENVMQHPFELVVRGQLRYYLPLSNKPKFIPISASTTVTPDKPIDEDDPQRNDTVRISARRTPVQLKTIRWQA